MRIFKNPDSSAPFEDTDLRSRRVSSDELSIEATEADHAVPLIVGVTGHRNLVPSEIPRLGNLVKNSLQDLERRFPHTPVQVMSTLAEGADMLVAEEAVKLDLPLIIPLPLALDVYGQDFTNQKSVDRLNVLCEKGEVLQLPLESSPPESRLTSRQTWARQYARLGIFVSSHCHILLVLWDGKPSKKLADTANVIHFHHHDVLPGYTDTSARSRLKMADDSSDLVYHIVCSRNQPDGDPSAPLKPFETFWLTTDEANPRTKDLPIRYQQIFARTAEFNLDQRRYADRIAAEEHSLLDQKGIADLAHGRRIDILFRTASWLAKHFQKRVNNMLRLTHLLAVLIGFAFIAYKNLPNQDNMIYAYLLFFAVGFFVFVIAEKRAWHRKYLDYRTLAEGLRVQFYWAAAGVKDEKYTNFAHENFLHKQDLELGWIRNVMRVASCRSVIEADSATDAGLEFAMRSWIGGQVEYFEKCVAVRTRLDRITKRIGFTCLSAGITATILLALFQTQVTENIKKLLIVLMGILPLIAAIREGYSYMKADKELINQYRFMHRIFAGAQRSLKVARDNEERREILEALGNVALQEHSEWILMHRKRPLKAKIR